MNDTDKQIIELWEGKGKQSPTLTGRAMGWNRQRVERRILQLRAEGIKLSPPRPRGYILQDNKQWASKIGKIGYSKGLGKPEDNNGKNT